MNIQKINLVVSAMSANKIKFNKQFESAVAHGFSDEAREAFFEEVVSEMEKILRHGINNQFNKPMKQAVADLSDIAVKLGEDSRRSLTLERLRFEKRNCMSNLKMTHELFAPEFDLCANIREYLDNSKEGIKVLQEDADKQMGIETANMKSCRKLIDEIIVSLDSVTDVTSQEAAKYYNEIITKIRSWRIKVARSGGMYDAASVEILNGVLKTVSEWSEINTPHLLRARVQDVYGIPVDDLTKAIESVAIKQNVEMFLNRCENYAKGTASMRDNGTNEKILASRARIRELEKKQSAVVVKFKNGQIERDDAEYELQYLKDQIDYLKFDIERLETDKVSMQEVNARREMISKIERPIRMSYNHVKNNRLHIHALFSGMDFSRLLSMVNNNINAAEFAIGIEEMQAALITRGVIDKQGKLLMENIQQKLDMVDNLNAQQVPELAQKEESGVSLLDQMLGADKTEEKATSGSLLDAMIKNDDIM